MQVGKKMDKNNKKYKCANCGFTSKNKFKEDICPNCELTYWKCEKCGFLIKASIPPNICPSCKEKCDFRNVTCYIPECGGPKNIDPKLI